MVGVWPENRGSANYHTYFVVFTDRHFEKFLFAHVTLIEGHVTRLQTGMERALTQLHSDADRANRGATFSKNCLDVSSAPCTSRNIGHD